MGKQTVCTYKMRSTKNKFSGVRYLHTIMASTKGIPSRETAIHYKKG